MLPRLAPGDPLDYLLGDAAFQLRRGVSSSDMEEAGATPRKISDMLREVAMGAQLVVLPG